jgi:hypothetical protein
MPEIKPLTRKNLARLNALNGTTEDNDIDSAYLFDGDSDDNTTKKISTTDSNFEQRAYENGILGPHSSRPPQGLDTIRHGLTRRRTSTQPSEHAHQVYCTRISESYNEAGAALLVHSQIMRDYNESDLNYGKCCSRAITEIPSQDFNKGLPDPFPMSSKALEQRFSPITCTTMLSTLKTRSLSVTSLPNSNVQMAISAKRQSKLPTMVPF